MLRIRQMRLKKDSWRYYLFDAWVILFTAFTIYLWHSSRTLAHQNHNRITDIQQQRVDSCVGTYNGIEMAFKPLIPSPKLRTPKQRRNIKAFYDNLGALKKNCPKQTGVTKGGDNGN